MKTFCDNQSVTRTMTPWFVKTNQNPVPTKRCISNEKKRRGKNQKRNHCEKIVFVLKNIYDDKLEVKMIE